jgi:hypothetical protein
MLSSSGWELSMQSGGDCAHVDQTCEISAWSESGAWFEGRRGRGNAFEALKNLGGLGFASGLSAHGGAASHSGDLDAASGWVAGGCQAGGYAL